VIKTAAHVQSVVPARVYSFSGLDSGGLA